MEEINKGIVIGIDGLTATGKSTVATKIIKKYKNVVHLEMSQLYKQIGEWYILLRNQKFTKSEIEYFIREYIKPTYKVVKQEVIFELNFPKPQLTMSTFYIKNEIYKLSKDDEIRKTLYKIIRKVIDELKETNGVIITGRRLKMLYPKMDYHFCLKASEDVRINRLMDRDNVSEEEAKIRKVEEKIYDIGTDVITVNSERLSPKEIMKMIENILISSNNKSKIIKVHFIGAPSTGKSTICKYCADKYNEVYTTEFVRDYMMEVGMNNDDLAAQGFDFWKMILKKQLSIEKKQEKVAHRFLFADSGPLTIGIGKGYMEKPEMIKLIDKQIEEADVIFFCDNEFGFVDDGMRPGNFEHSNDVEIKTKKYLNEHNIPYITLSGTVLERFKSVQQVLKKYEVNKR